MISPHSLTADDLARRLKTYKATTQPDTRPEPDEVKQDVCAPTGTQKETKHMPRRLKLTEDQLQSSYDRIAAGESAGKVAKDIPCGGPALLRHLRKAGYDMDFVTKRRGAGAVDFKVEQAEALTPPPAPPKPSQNGHISIPHPAPEPAPATTAVVAAEPAAALQPAGELSRQLDAVRELLSLADAGRVQVSGTMRIALNVEIDLS